MTSSVMRPLATRSSIASCTTRQMRSDGVLGEAGLLAQLGKAAAERFAELPVGGGHVRPRGCPPTVPAQRPRSLRDSG